MDLFDLYQQGKIHEARERAEAAQSEAARVAAQIQTLQRKADTLALACQALWEILRERTDLTDSDLIARMQAIDQRDGTADGRMTPMPVECPSCKRRTNSQRGECLYCGTRLPGRQIFEQL